MKKYKFILTLDEYTRVDSAEEIEGHVSWPNYSQADPVRYKGVFDTYEEAKEYASNFSLYKYLDFWDYYDSYEEAREAAESYIEDYKVETDEYPCDWLYPIEVEKVEIVEFDDEEE